MQQKYGLVINDNKYINYVKHTGIHVQLEDFSLSDEHYC
jgi:hypothetical protein